MRRVIALLAALAAALAAASCGAGGKAEGPGGRGNVLKWTTSWERESVGFDIYRAPAREGPFERITPAPIPGRGVSQAPQDYRFEDTAIDPTREYYYYVEVVKANGERTKITPVMRGKPKAPK